MAKKDGDHPEFDDVNFSEEESNESGSDALSFSGLGLGGSELGNNSGLFDFSEDDSSEESSLDLAGTGDDEAILEEPLDLEVEAVEEADDDLSSFEDSSLGEMSLDEPVLDEMTEPDLDAVDMDTEPEAAPAKGKKGKKAKAKKEKKPKKVKAKKEKVVKERKPRSPSDKQGLLTQARKASPFMVMLFLSAASLFIAIVLLLIEWGSYGFNISAS